jgi:isoamylase
LSQGTPMICGGDEMGRTQNGNNNAYCQDNEISWYDWDLDEDAKALIAFTKRALSLLRAHPVLRRRSFFKGSTDGGLLTDISWYDSTGQPMTTAKWQDPQTRCLAFLLAGDQVDLIKADGNTLDDDDLLVILNASTSPVEFTVPGRPTQQFQVVLDTDQPYGTPSPGAAVEVGTQLSIAAQTVLVATASVF